MNDFSGKFEKDHRSIQMLTLAERVKQHNFNRRSVQNELFAKYVPKYSTRGVIDFEQFVRFLEDHMIKQPGSDQMKSMFE